MQRIVFYITVFIIAAFIIISKTFSPVWLLLLVVAILWSQRNVPEVRPAFLLAILLMCLFIVFTYFSILAPFIIGIGIAYILAPLVDILEKRKVPRPIAILIFLIPIVALFPLLCLLIIAGLLSELDILRTSIPYTIYQVQIYLSVFIDRLAEIGVRIDPNIIANTIATNLSNLLSSLFSGIGQIGRGIGGIILLIYNLVIIPLSAYQFLADREKITNWFRNIFYGHERDRVDQFIKRLNISLAHFFRGQIILIIVVGFIVGFALWALGIKYYLLLGLIAGLCNIIPNVGYVLSFIPALVIGVLSPTPLTSVIKIILVYVGEQLLENFYLGPAIIGRSSRLHPVLVMIVLMLGGTIFGFWGVLLAIPVTIFVREFLIHFLNLSV